MMILSSSRKRNNHESSDIIQVSGVK